MPLSHLVCATETILSSNFVQRTPRSPVLSFSGRSQFICIHQNTLYVLCPSSGLRPHASTTLALNTFSIGLVWFVVRTLPCACLLSTSTLCSHHRNLRFEPLSSTYTSPSPSRSILDVSEPRRSTVQYIGGERVRVKMKEWGCVVTLLVLVLAPVLKMSGT